MSENIQASIGQVLRDAREAQGLTVGDAAVRLRLMHRQIEAMEADAFESLGQPVFARGFVRNYARLVGVAPETLLVRMEGAPAEPAEISQAEPPEARSWLASPWLILLLLGVLVLVAVPVSLYLWLNSDMDGSPNSPAPVAQTDSVPVVVAPDAVMPAAAPPDTPAATDVPVAPATVTVESAEAATPATPAVPSAPSIPAVSSVVHLEFGDAAWVEVKDASGRMLHRQLNSAGSSVDIHGQPPFDLVIGNADQVRMTYNGRPINLKPFIAVTVARFALEE